ncbi:MAG TPA: heparan-alpha-glucosaminide N-acetyltransferase domain-containing protein [Candidatus Sulfotelmatobacter sp.]|nr:heparan-alpha-glucosaminide N-acetyltransferase domain-containing protein [Candidatus Sulfotelmatobacter sp.]
MASPVSLTTQSANSSSTPVAAGRIRLESIDILRGVIMILMALDHTRDFFGNSGLNPTNPATTTIPLFFTRWITHFCAPGFFLLTGTGAYLRLRKSSRRELSKFLFTRGLWLIFLELTFFRCLGWQFNFDYKLTMIIVLWALGWAMITLSVLVYLPTWLVTTFGAVMIAGHNLLDKVEWSNPLWTILHDPGFLVNRPGHQVFVPYVLIPWVGVTAVGFGLGKIFDLPPERRRAWLLRLGLVLVAAFLILRGINHYGDFFPWSTQRSPAFTVLSFLNTSKYPPSLLYLLMTLGPELLALWALDRGTPRVLRPALVFGKVPMFYYMLHVPLIHLLAVAFCYVRYGSAHWMFQSPDIRFFPITPPPGWGASLPIVYLIWAFVVVTLYPACRWFAGVKQRRKDAWLSYF